MRLINVDTMKMEESIDDGNCLYLILSHTWTAEEISFQDYMWLQNHEEEVADGVIDELPPKQLARAMAEAEALRRRAGYKKVFNFIRRARRLLEEHSDSSPPTLNAGGRSPVYVWIDTCCINKESSAELSEAINSMYRWYKRSDLCVALLTDVAGVVADPDGEFGKSRWFTRGGTLQELLAPDEVVFYNKRGKFIGYRSRIAGSIEAITPIRKEYLLDPANRSRLRKAAVAQRMSWAAKRRTTRIEDKAYCLLGIFDVSMPLLYGEGSKSFAASSRRSSRPLTIKPSFPGATIGM
ncbi:hypothetical protein NKR19_g5863 [Coniochaeta hoffmannii]|uniref:Heterokaryon incompatibility domain-containing protein n=1 Tax=Coniochaeta hoffmannii TaxID=91930 RepID=A0AA38RUS5_9PEZI|nr:hypothetical protein NKR19_g5863 [Coniochaeta hoffmannii]